MTTENTMLRKCSCEHTRDTHRNYLGVPGGHGIGYHCSRCKCERYTEAVSPAPLDAEHAPTIHHPAFGAPPYIACKCGWGHYDSETDFMAHTRRTTEEPS